MLLNFILLALFIEAIVAAVKPLWKDGGNGLTVTEIVSIVLGIVFAVALRIDMLSAFVSEELMKNAPAWLYYIFYAMSGIAIGRGPSFVADLWKNIKTWGHIEIKDGIPIDDLSGLIDESMVDLNIENWSIEQLREFCILNDIPAEGCVTKDDYMTAIERGGITQDPPDSGT